MDGLNNLGLHFGGNPKRNEIEDYRRQDERPVERTQEEQAPRQKQTCPACKGTTGVITIGKGREHFTPCARCNGEGVI
jgi:DnaJ-class molecular chaperone